MPNYILTNEPIIRLCVFGAVLTIMILAETLWPRKVRVLGRVHRWSSNLLLMVLGSLTLRFLFPIAAVGTALWAQSQGWGLLNVLALPAWLETLVAIILLDLAIYGQHVATHRIPLLWALHKVHHADRDIDVTTGIRFHPIEILFSMGYKMVIILALGPAALAVIIFEIILNACALFNHSNVRLPLAIDKALRLFIVTPDVHRIHHSVIESETNRNFGFSVTLWDRIFRTYQAQPAKGHDDMTIGLTEYQMPGPASATWSLALPFGKGLKRLQNWL